jgi:hypothetical protein
MDSVWRAERLVLGTNLEPKPDPRTERRKQDRRGVLITRARANQADPQAGPRPRPSNPPSGYGTDPLRRVIFCPRQRDRDQDFGLRVQRLLTCVTG